MCVRHIAFLYEPHGEQSWADQTLEQLRSAAQKLSLKRRWRRAAGRGDRRLAWASGGRGAHIKI